MTNPNYASKSTPVTKMVASMTVVSHRFLNRCLHAPFLSLIIVISCNLMKNKRTPNLESYTDDDHRGQIIVDIFSNTNITLNTVG